MAIAKWFRKRQPMHDQWSIGLGWSDSPLKPPAPTIHFGHGDLGSNPSVSVADPFLFAHAGQMFLFFESLNLEIGRGEIGVATVSGSQVQFEGIVLTEHFHLSYPFVFGWEGEVYMMPEAAASGALRLYRARDFPFDWEPLPPLMEGKFADASLLELRGKWWMFTSTKEGKRWVLSLFHAPTPLGPWAPHPMNPIRHRPSRTCRPGGRPFVVDGEPILFTQNGRKRYGHQVWAHRITTLTETEYREKLLPGPFLTASGNGWNMHGMHQFDALKVGDKGWLCAMDGVQEVKLTK